MAYVAEDDVKRSLKITYTTSANTNGSRTYPGLNVYTGASAGQSAVDGAPFSDVCMLFSSLLGDASTAQITNHTLVEEQVWSPE